MLELQRDRARSGRIESAIPRPTTHIAAAANQGMTRVSSSRSFPANSGRKTSGPSAAPNRAPKRTYEIARAFFSGGYMSAAAVRASRTPPFMAPTPTKPRTTSEALSTTHPSAVIRQATTPMTKPPAITGTRPNRSISRPAGSAATAPAVRKIAGPRPRIDSTPVTRTRVIVATATASCSTPREEPGRGRAVRCCAGSDTKSPRSSNSTTRPLLSRRLGRTGPRYDAGSVWGARATGLRAASAPPT